MQSEVAALFDYVGTSPEDDRERDAVADCTVEGQALDDWHQLQPGRHTEACNRLIKNSIICWNYLYLAWQLKKVPDEETRENLLRAIAAHVPVAWGHINMLGEYDFAESNLKDALGNLPRNMPLKTALQTGGYDHENFVKKMVGIVPLF